MNNGAATLCKMMKRKSAGDSPALMQACPCLGLALGKITRQLFDVNVDFEPADGVELSLNAVLQAAPEPGLLVVIQTPDGRKGLLTLDGMLINALVELMTGASDRAVYKQARVPTLIDIALCKEFCTSLLDTYPGELAKGVGQVALPKLMWSQSEVEAVKLAFILENTPIRRMSGRVSFQDGLRGGELSLAMPVDVWAATGSIKPALQEDGWKAKLTENVLNSRLPLRANLETIEMPLIDALSLKSGDFLQISAFALSDLGLSSLDGQVLLHGRLGQENGKKAICVTRSGAGLMGPMLELQPLKKKLDPAPDGSSETVDMAGNVTAPV